MQAIARPFSNDLKIMIADTSPPKEHLDRATVEFLCVHTIVNGLQNKNKSIKNAVHCMSQFGVLETEPAQDLGGRVQLHGCRRRRGDATRDAEIAVGSSNGLARSSRSCSKIIAGVG
eukprot:SAG31_NODE_3640_length_4033_cov_4.161413_3_plen_117_part_00